jgi:hypothetical protein
MEPRMTNTSRTVADAVVEVGDIALDMRMQPKEAGWPRRRSSGVPWM